VREISVVYAPKEPARKLQSFVRTPKMWRVLFYTEHYSLLEEEEGFLVLRRWTKSEAAEELFLCIGDGIMWGYDLSNYFENILVRTEILFMIGKEKIPLEDPLDFLAVKELFRKTLEERRLVE